MVGIARFSERAHMATHALGRKSEAIELPYRANFMARITIHHGMRADQGKSILVLIDVVNRYLPAICVMAQLAFRPIFSAMEIRVAVLTFFWHVAKYQIRVTIDALYFRVSAAQRESRLRVLEFHFRPQRLPPLLRVTLLAGNIELFSMRALFLCIGIRSLRSKSTRR